MFMSWPEQEKLDDACDEDQLASTEHWLHLAMVERLEATCLLQALLQDVSEWQNVPRKCLKMVLGHQVYNYHDAVDDIHRFLKVIVPATCEATSLAKIDHTEARAALFAACEHQRLLSTMSALQVMKLDGCTSAPLINRAKVGFQVLSFRSQ